MPRKLKVYRTATGFHDAYVAAPSQKAALAAWGTDKDLFARGAAEVVDDPVLTAEPLAHPGEVIRRARGTTAEQLAALGPAPKRKRARAEPQEEPPRQPRAGTKPQLRIVAPPPPPPPPPDREGLDFAERSLAAIEQRHAEERQDIAEREARLREDKQRLLVEQKRELTDATVRVAREKRDYANAMKEWRKG